MEILIITTVAICTIITLYCIYQLVRNHRVYEIRMRWIFEDDERRYQYSYDYMFDPSKSNLYGLIFPRESHYQKT